MSAALAVHIVVAVAADSDRAADSMTVGSVLSVPVLVVATLLDVPVSAASTVDTVHRVAYSALSAAAVRLIMQDRYLRLVLLV